MNNKYYNNAFIGNKNITASFSDKGELLRLYRSKPRLQAIYRFILCGNKSK